MKTLKLVNDRPRHPQSQGCVERANADMKKKVQIWMKENNTSNWSMGLRFVQWQMNNSYLEALRTKPYTALFGSNPRCGLAKKMPEHFFLQIGCSDMREEVLEYMLHGDTNDQPGSSADMPEQVEEEIDLQYDDYIIQEEEEHQNSLEKRAREENSEDEAEDEHPAKRIRLQARAGIEKQAARMLSRSSQSLKPLSPGDNVAIPVSQFDRSNGDPPNVIGDILSVHGNGLFKVGTTSGRISGKLSRSQIEPIKYKGLTDQDVPADIELSLKEIVCAQNDSQNVTASETA